METGTQRRSEETPTFPGQGEPGTGPGQLNQEPQQQSEEGLQPIPVVEKHDGEACVPEEQAEQNKRPRDPEGHGNPPPDRDNS